MTAFEIAVLALLAVICFCIITGNDLLRAIWNEMRSHREK